MTHRFVPHKINWTEEKSARFWDYLSSKSSYQENNFSKLAGEALIKFVKHCGVTLRGTILDFGCGPGFLLELLLKKGISCGGAESSPATADLANKRLEEHSRFQGVEILNTLPLPFKNESFEAIFMAETIEHILPKNLTPTLKEIYRTLKTGGYIIITTPNEENLEGGKIICPDCGCIFHNGQHLSAWTADSLSRLMADNRFRKIVCRTIHLRPPSKLNFLRSLIASIQKHKKMNLVYIGQK